MHATLWHWLETNEQVSCSNHFGPKKEAHLQLEASWKTQSLQTWWKRQVIYRQEIEPLAIQPVANHFTELAPAGCSENSLPVHSSTHNEVVML
jgi:hypothetical protein